MRVLFADSLHQKAAASLRADGFELEICNVAGSELSEALARFDPAVLVVRSTQVGVEQLDACADLSLVIRAGAGVNTIDVAAAAERGIYVANCPGRNASAVAELAFGLILAADRGIARGDQLLRAGRWRKGVLSKLGRGLKGRVLGLVGLGRIGQEMVRIGHGFGMKVVGWSRSLDQARASELGIYALESPEMVAGSAQVVSVHLALTDETRGFCGADFFNAMKPGSIFINTSRAPVVDQPALLDAARNRGLRVGLDVFADEPAGKEADFQTPLVELENFVGSHHVGASTEQAQEAVADAVVKIIQVYSERGRVKNCVNKSEQALGKALLVVRHKDRVGVLARVLTCMQHADINVQQMENIIFAGGHAACARLHLSEPLEASAIAGLKSSCDDIYAVEQVMLNNPV